MTYSNESPQTQPERVVMPDHPPLEPERPSFSSDKTSAAVPSSRQRLRRLASEVYDWTLIGVSLAALGGAATGVACLPPELKYPRLFLEAHSPIHPFGVFEPPQCKAGWMTDEVNPKNFAAGFQEVYRPIATEYRAIQSADLTDRHSNQVDNETQSHNAYVGYAFNDLESASLFGQYETLDETVEVSCKAGNGKFYASELALQTLRDLQGAGYDIDFQTGQVTYPR